MTAALEDMPTPAGIQEHSEHLKSQMAAMKLTFHWLGTRKALSTEQIMRAADIFDAERKFVSAGKKLFDTSNPAFRRVTAVKSSATNFYKSVSLPFPEPGLRLIRQDEVEKIDDRMREHREELDDAVSALENQFDDLTAEARDRLGDLFDPADYPNSLNDIFRIEWSFPTVEAPDYLRRLNPELYEQECHRVRSQFEEAVRLAEQAFIEEFGKLIDHLQDRLSGAEDGKVKIFRDSAVTNFDDFFQRFTSLNIGSNSELDTLVDRARKVVSGVQPQSLRTQDDLRGQIHDQLTSIQASLDGLMVDRPRRNIIR
ncbi:hypothetical protein [Roseiconus lacunae]|uniref:hypothetical protein n=1 Tax=Roseiconus lacunae TaxID=2605694 RepID=UPI001E50AC41|nr:hypothetical protein [Roseiconus lacunae]MCD0462493.1 hypothetical protein [Roseiconus lacunae]